MNQSYRFLPAMQADVPQHVDMLESLRRGATVLYDSDHAMLMCQEGDVYALAATHPEAALRAVEALPHHARSLVVRSPEMIEWAAAHGMTQQHRCVQMQYTHPLPPVPVTMTIRHPDMADWDLVRSSYHLIDEQSLYRHFVSEDFFAGYVGRQLVAFAGLHEEGAMGMLYVLPQYRRQGYAQQLTVHIVNRQLSLGRYAYAQIFADNVASIRLQQKLHAGIESRPICWCLCPDED